MQVETPRPVRSCYIVTVLIIATAYYVTGRLGLLLAIPPGYATAVWPPSGLALAATLIYGYRVWPGIMLGSVLVNIATSFEATTAMVLLRSVLLASSIGLGAALQAVVGASLVRRCVGFPSALNQEREIGIFLVLGGPVSCLVSATIGVTTLWMGGKIPWALYPISWWTWWVGDTIGVLIITPLVLSWVAEPQSIWRWRRVSMALPLAGAFALAVVFFVYTSAREQERLRISFERQAETLAHTLQNRLEDYLGVLYATESFFAGSRKVSRQKFHTFVQRLFARHPGLQALSFDRHVPDTQRAAYEEAVRWDGYPDFQITEQDVHGRMVRAAQRPEYVVVTYIEPYAGNEMAFGFDVASEPGRLAALHQARDTGVPIATGRLMLVQETGHQFGLLVFLPIYGNELPRATVEERRQHLRGYATGVFRIGDMVEAALRGLDRQGIGLRIEDETAPAGQRLLYNGQEQAQRGTAPGRDAASGESPTGLSWNTTVELAGRRWRLRLVPTLEYLAARQSLQPWTVLVGGLLFTSLLGAFILILTGRATSIEQLVAERTAELSRANTALAREVTERQQAEEALERLRRQNDLILNAAGEGVLGVDPQGKVTFVNPLAASVTRYTVDELIGRRLNDTLCHMDPDTTSNVWEASPISATLQDGTVRRATGEVFWRKDGTRFPVEYVSTPMREDGAVIGAVVTFQDITERQAVERMKDEFISVVSHELRTPLTSIRCALGLLASGRLGILSDKGQRLLDIAVTNTDRLVRLINDILDLERIGSGKITMEPKACDAANLMTQAGDMMRAMAEQAGVTLSVAPVSARLWADPDHILQTLMNLLSNAIKFSPPGATVWLRAERAGPQLVFQVQDQGRGIPAAKLEVIFERFQQVDASDSRKKGGTGLGLAICRSIVQQHGGRIWAESTLGQGSTFCFTLPVLPEEELPALAMTADDCTVLVCHGGT
jgi:PAS domain S-box-containing protein